jgi:hypothetical protein
MKAKYSGDKSTDFWVRINAVRGDVGHSLYSLACDLQDLESEVLGILKEAEAGQTKQKDLKKRLKKARKVQRR